MIVQRWIAFALAAALLGAAAAQAAELPSERGKTTSQSRPNRVKTCDVAGFPGVLAANGVCVRISGYVSSQFGAGQLK